MLKQALVGATLIPQHDSQPIAGEALQQLASSYLLARAVIDRIARLIDRDVLVAILRNGLKLDLHDAESARSSAERLQRVLGAAARRFGIMQVKFQPVPQDRNQ